MARRTAAVEDEVVTAPETNDVYDPDADFEAETDLDGFEAESDSEDTPDTGEDEDAPVASTSEETTAAAPAEAETEEQMEAKLVDFKTVLAEAVDQRDTETGDLPLAPIDKVNVAYRSIDGIKPKNRARKFVEDQMMDAMNERDIQLARAYMQIREKLSTATVKGSGSKREPVERKPVNPTEAFVERVATLQLASSLVVDEAPEGVDENWEVSSDTLVSESYEAAGTYRAWLTGDEATRGDEPDATSVVKAAVKLALGRSAKPGKAVRVASTGGSGRTYTGPQRHVEAHVQSAFADLESGAFLTVAQIVNHTSEEYGDDHPSPGAVSIRLFPKSGSCTIEGVVPDTNEKGSRGARKA